RNVERWEGGYGSGQRLDHDVEHFTRVDLRVVEHTMGHEVAAIRPFSEVSVHSGTPFRSAQISNRRGKAREKLQINCGIESDASHPDNQSSGAPSHRGDGACGHG